MSTLALSSVCTGLGRPLLIPNAVLSSSGADASALDGSAMKLEDYAIRIEPLPQDEGGGFLVTVPDLPGCVADGETIDAAIAEAQDAFQAWTTAERQDKGRLPVPKA